MVVGFVAALVVVIFWVVVFFTDETTCVAVCLFVVEVVFLQRYFLFLF